MTNIIEIGQDYCNIWHIQRKKERLSKLKQIILPEGFLTSPKLLADLLNDIPKGKIFFLLNIAGTNVSLLSDINIPKHFNFNKYINSQASLPDGRFWLTTIPAQISDTLLEVCRIKKIRLERIQAIDTLEYRLANYGYHQAMADTHLFLPFKTGIRLIIFDNNGICHHYFFSNNPKFREEELKRIYMSQNNALPQNAVVLSDNCDCNWLRNFNKNLIFDNALKEKALSFWLN